MFRLNKNTKIIIIILILLAAGAVLLVLEKTQVINLYTRKPDASEGARTTSTTPTAQEDFNDGEAREPGNSLDENDGSGGIIDENGNIGDVDTSNPITSAGGEITVYSPKTNMTIAPGQKLAGVSTLPKVSYRLIDELSGVIAMGELTVVGGKFSGSISFTSNADQGRLDLYGTRNDGAEFSNVEIPIRLK